MKTTRLFGDSIYMNTPTAKSAEDQQTIFTTNAGAGSISPTSKPSWQFAASVIIFAMTM